LPYLLEVCAAAVARQKVRFEARPLERLHSTLDVIGNKLHELLTGQVVDIVSHSKDLSDLSRGAYLTLHGNVMRDERRWPVPCAAEVRVTNTSWVETNPLWPQQSQEEILT
jgi:hypothetical protein